MPTFQTHIPVPDPMSKAQFEALLEELLPVAGLVGNGLKIVANEIVIDPATAMATSSPQSGDFTAVAGNLYFVTPDASTTLVATLPTSDRGPIGFKLLNAASDRQIAVDPTTDAVEDNTAGDRIIIDHEDLVVWFHWDGTVWRIS